jgi:NADP-dependent 3-hydroxy acid dehydrogenase YdfG
VSGLDVELVPGERIPDEVLVAAKAALSEFVARPEDVADVVYYAVTQPAGVYVTEIVVRPKRDIALT